MNNRIKSLFLLALLSGQLRAEDTVLVPTVGNKQKIAKKVEQLKVTAKKAVVAIKEHPLVTLWGGAGAVLLAEVFLNFREDRRRRIAQAEREVHNEQIKKKRVEGLIEDLSNNSASCPICMETIEHTQAALTKCGHLFHGFCLNRFLGYSSTCPTCRCALGKKDISGV